MKTILLSLLTYVIFFSLSSQAFLLARPTEYLSDSDLITAGAEITAEKYPNADAVLVDDYTLTVYETNGLYTSVNDYCMKVLTEKGKRDNMTLGTQFNVSYGTAIVSRVNIIKPDGTIIPVDIEKQSKTMVDRSQMRMNIYDPKQKVLQISVPGLEINDMVRVIIKRRQWKARVPNTFSDYNVFEHTMPICKQTLDIFGLTNLPLVHTLVKAPVKDTVTYTMTPMGPSNKYSWVVKDVPRMFQEPAMPALHTVVQRLLVSTIPDWETVARWYADLCEEPLSDTTPEMTNVVKELIANCTTDKEKIEAVFRYVSQKIRYMGITTEDSAPGYEPHPVSMTFENKYGVCRDKAALLATMLNIAGIDAYPVLIYAGPKKDEEVPQPFFNHAITAVRKDDGEYILMDSTDETTRDLFPTYLGDMSYLVAVPEGDTLRTSPVDPADNNLVHVQTDAALDGGGNLSAETTIVFDGINDNAYRSFMLRAKPIDRRLLFEKIVKRVLPGAVLESFRITPDDLQNMEDPLTVHITYTAKDVLIEGERTVMVPPLWFGASVGMINFIIDNTGLEERKYPFQTRYACGVEDSFTLDVSTAVDEPIALPTFTAVKTPEITWEGSVEKDGRVIHGESAFKLHSVELDPEEYLTLKKTLKQIEYDKRKLPLFVSVDADTTDSIDVRYHNIHSSIDVQSPTSWTVTKNYKQEVCTYKGKKEAAELKVDYTPAWESVDIQKAVVTSPDGTENTLKEEEINIMDGASVASAPRYPVTKTLVASLPNVDTGSIIEVTYTLTAKDKPFFNTMSYFAAPDKVDKKTVDLTVPDSIAVAITNCPGGTVAEKTEKSGSSTAYTWSATNLPMVKMEDNLPPWWYISKGFLVSDGNWKDYAQEVLAVFNKNADGQFSAADKVRELTSNTRDPREKIRAIRNFIEKNIRRTGPSFVSIPLEALTPADVTLKEGYGNSADKAVLYATMLKAAGLEPEYVIASSAPRATNIEDPRLTCPQRDIFSYVLVRVSINGVPVYLNDTDQYAHLGATRHDRRPGLCLTDGSILRIEAATTCDDRLVTEYDVVFDEDGNAKITQKRTFYGTYYQVYKKQYEEMPPEERKRHHLEMVSDIARGAEKDGELTTEFSVYPGTESFSVNVDNYAVRDGKFFYFTLPQELGNVLGLAADERTNPLYWENAKRRTYITRVTLPDSIQSCEMLPENLIWRAPNDAGEISMTTQYNSEQPTLITLTREIDLRPAVIPADEYGCLLDMNRQLSHPELSTLLIRLKDE